MFKTRYRVVQDKDTGKFRVKQRSFLTAYWWVFVGVSPQSYDTLEEAKAAVEKLKMPRFQVVHEE